MIPSQLAAEILAVVTPVLIKGGEAISEGIGKDIWQGIKNLFKRGNKIAALDKLENNPTDETTREEVKAHLTSMLYANDIVKEQLEKLLVAFKSTQQGNNVKAVGNEKTIISGDSISGNTINIS